MVVIILVAHIICSSWVVKLDDPCCVSSRNLKKNGSFSQPFRKVPPPESVSMRIHAAKVHETNHFCSLFRVMFHKQLVFHAIFVAKDDIDHVDRSLQCKPDVSILHLIKEHRDPKSPEISRLRKYLKLRHNKPRNHDSKRHKTENKQTTWLNQPMP